MPKFDTRVQELRYNVLKRVITHLDQGDLKESFYDIPKEVIPGPKPSMRCCIYKERAIIQERIKIAAFHNSKMDENVIKVIPIACDECPLGGYTVSDACRGCIAHRCSEACPKKCISFDENLRAHIDKSQCVNCGMCAKSCPYSAIENRTRPCERACKQKAISPNPETNAAQINDAKCIHCGACVYTCPFGAIVDVSYISEIIDILKNSENNTKYKVFAVVAPSIGGNFIEYKNGQIIAALKKLGFYDVAEAALGADMVAISESKELMERGKLTSSCCPAFALYIRKFFPELAQYISTSPSPMHAVSKYIKSKHPGAKVIFIGPCTAKKSEIKHESVRPYVDSCLTFEELQAFFDARNINIAELPEDTYGEYGGSFFGRGFAKCGGLSSAVNEAIAEQGAEFTVKGQAVDGMENVKKALLAFKNPKNDINFLEGMACEGGCIGGPCNLQHQIRNKMTLDKYSAVANKNIKENVDKKAN